MMKLKEGRDYLSFDECIASVEEIDEVTYILVANSCEQIRMTAKEFESLVKFYNKSKGSK